MTLLGIMPMVIAPKNKGEEGISMSPMVNNKRITAQFSVLILLALCLAGCSAKKG